jgi:RNA polymerase sigma-70 factor, ECF subfamily
MRPELTEEAFLRHVLSERQKLLAYLRSIVRRRDVAEDLFQDVCVLALQKRAEIVDAAHLSAWLRIAARQLAMNAIRKHGHREQLLGDRIHELMESRWNQLDRLDASALGEALEHCLHRLGAPARALLKARYTEGLSSGELAQRLGRPVGSLYTTLSRIHKALAQCVLQRVRMAAAGSTPP